MNNLNIDWSKQHCGVHQADVHTAMKLMPDIGHILAALPDDPRDFTFDIKVHMLMPGMFPCIPNWHMDFVPRPNGPQDFSKIDDSVPMYLWVSNGPLTQFKSGFLRPQTWHKFKMSDEHRGIAADDFCWRGMIRAVHESLLPPKNGDNLRRHSQVYLDSNDYVW